MLPGPSLTPTSTQPEQARIRLKPVGCQQAVSGGWWPRSEDLLEELPALLAGLWDRLGNVHRVDYNMLTWPVAAGRQQLGGQWIQLDGCLTQHPQSISLGSAARGETMTLLVVPVDTDPAAADAALTVSATPGSGSSISAMLATAGVAVGGRRGGDLTRPRASIRAAHAAGESLRALAAQAESGATARSRAARTVAGRADDVEDCRQLLAMLGLDGEPAMEQH
jgi:hypothetical protein